MRPPRDQLLKSFVFGIEGRDMLRFLEWKGDSVFPCRTDIYLLDSKRRPSLLGNLLAHVLSYTKVRAR